LPATEIGQEDDRFVPLSRLVKLIFRNLKNLQKLG
jgi:hypothetical protein